MPSPLHDLAKTHGDKIVQFNYILERHLAAGGKVDTQDPENGNTTCLQLAAMHGNIRIVASSLQHGANPRLKTTHNKKTLKDRFSKPKARTAGKLAKRYKHGAIHTLLTQAEENPFLTVSHVKACYLFLCSEFAQEQLDFLLRATHFLNQILRVDLQDFALTEEQLLELTSIEGRFINFGAPQRVNVPSTIFNLATSDSLPLDRVHRILQTRKEVLSFLKGDKQSKLNGHIAKKDSKDIESDYFQLEHQLETDKNKTRIALERLGHLLENDLSPISPRSTLGLGFRDSSPFSFNFLPKQGLQEGKLTPTQKAKQAKKKLEITQPQLASLRALPRLAETFSCWERESLLNSYRMLIFGVEPEATFEERVAAQVKPKHRRIFSMEALSDALPVSPDAVLLPTDLGRPKPRSAQRPQEPAGALRLSPSPSEVPLFFSSTLASSSLALSPSSSSYVLGSILSSPSSSSSSSSAFQEPAAFFLGYPSAPTAAAITPLQQSILKNSQSAFELPRPEAPRSEEDLGQENAPQNKGNEADMVPVPDASGFEDVGGYQSDSGVTRGSRGSPERRGSPRRGSPVRRLRTLRGLR